MNVMTKAHALTKQVIQAGDNYAATFALCLKQVHMEANPMKAAINQMIDSATQYIARLEAFKATNPVGYIIVTGSGRMPVQFDSDSAKVSSIENANRFNDLRIAKAKGRQITNGCQETGVAVYVTEQVEWEIGQQEKLIADLNNALKNLK